MNLKSDAYCNRIPPHTIIYDRIRQSYSSVYGVQTVTFKPLHIFIRSPYTVSVSHRFTPHTVPVYGSRVRPPYVSVFHRKRPFTTVHVRPGYDQEKFVNGMRENLLERQQILNELQTRLQAFADCLQQEEQVVAAQRIKKQQSNSNT